MWRLHMHTIVSRAPSAAGEARGGLGDTWILHGAVGTPCVRVDVRCM
jgi:hypothetical protein